MPYILHSDTDKPVIQENAEDAASPVNSSHAAHFYSSDALLVTEVAQRLGVTLAAGGSALIIATPAHRESIEHQLCMQGFDLVSIARHGRWLALDAAPTLAEFMVDSWPDGRRFTSLMGQLMDRLTIAADPEDPRIAVFGEMVSLLWEDGKNGAAIRLEHLWNDLATTHRFHLSCGWPLRFFSRATDGVIVQKICSEHTQILPTLGYHGLTEEERRRGAFLWQLKAHVLLQHVSQIARKTLGFYRNTPSPLWISVPDAIDDVLSIYEGRFRNSGISIRKNIRPGLEVCAMQGEFKHILSNLVANALDSSFQGSSVYIAAWESRHPVTSVRGIRLVVGDQGVGIPPSIRHNVFTPFFAAQKDISIGLGLWVVRDLVEKMGGFIRCRSRLATPEDPHSGSGTMMMAFLPSDSDASAWPQRIAS